MSAALSPLATLEQVTSPDTVQKVLNQLGMGQDQFQDKITSPVWQMLITYENQGYIAQKDYGSLFVQISNALDEAFPFPQLKDHDATLRVEGVMAVMQGAVDHVWPLKFPNTRREKPSIKEEHAKAEASRAEINLLKDGTPPAKYKPDLKKVPMIPQDQLEQVYAAAGDNTHTLNGNVGECAFFFPDYRGEAQFKGAIERAFQKNELRGKRSPASHSSRLYGMNKEITLGMRDNDGQRTANYFYGDLLDGVLERAGYQAVPFSPFNDGQPMSVEELKAAITEQLKTLTLENLKITQREGGRGLDASGTK